MRIRHLLVLLVFLLTPAAGAARADILLLADGRMIDGYKLTKSEKGVTIHFEHGDVLVPMDQVQDALIEGGGSVYVPKTPQEKEKFEKGLVPYDGKWMKPARRDELVKKKIKAKRAEMEEIRKHSEWRNRLKVKTKHFSFESTVPPHVFEYYSGLMEAYYKEFSKSWKVTQPKEKAREGDGARLYVCFYSNLKEFGRTGGAGGGVRGYFKFSEPWELNFYYDRGDPRYTEEVMFHETNHYLVHCLDVNFSMPHYPGEALAEYYGASTWDPARKKLTVGQIQEGRLTDIQSDAAAGEMLPLRKMLETSRMYEHYSYGWASVHMFMNDSKMKKKFEKWVDALVTGRDVKRVAQGLGSLKTVEGPEVFKTFKRYMGIKNDAQLAALEKEWHAYIKDKLQVISARGLEKAAQGAMSTGRPIRATRLFKEAIATGDASALCHHRYAELISGKGQKDEAIQHWRKAIELEPLGAQFYTALADALIDKGEKEEGRKLAKLALEIDPEDTWLAFRVRELLEKD